MSRLNRGHAGHYQEGALVRLGEWVFVDKRDPGMLVPRDWEGGWWNPLLHKVIRNFSSTTGVVIVENQRTGARFEIDAYTPVCS